MNKTTWKFEDGGVRRTSQATIGVELDVRHLDVDGEVMREKDLRPRLEIMVAARRASGQDVSFVVRKDGQESGGFRLTTAGAVDAGRKPVVG